MSMEPNLVAPIRKFANGAPVVCRVPKHPECDFSGKVCGFVGSWGSKNTWYDVSRNGRTERFYGSYVKKA